MTSKHTALIKEALELLAQCRIFAWQNNTGAVNIKGSFIRFGKTGSYDIIAVFPPSGKHIEFDAKVLPDKLSKEQIIHGNMVRKLGGAAYSFYSMNELKEHITEELHQGQIQIPRILE